MPDKAKCKEAQRYLWQIRKLDVRIDSMLEEVAHLRAMATKVTTTLKHDGGSGGGNQDKIGDAIAKIVDLEVEISNSIDEYVDKKREVCAVIDQVKNADQAEVLYKRYVLNENWEQIAEEMHCCYRNACYIHGSAIQAVAAILEKQKGE